MIKLNSFLLIVILIACSCGNQKREKEEMSEISLQETSTKSHDSKQQPEDGQPIKMSEDSIQIVSYHVFSNNNILNTEFESLKSETDIGNSYLRMRNSEGDLLWELGLFESEYVLVNDSFVVKINPEEYSLELVSVQSGKITSKSKFSDLDLSDGGEPTLLKSSVFIKLLDNEYSTIAIASIRLPDLMLDTLDIEVRGYIRLNANVDGDLTILSAEDEIIKVIEVN